jgi:hypothetical protein
MTTEANSDINVETKQDAPGMSGRIKLVGVIGLLACLAIYLLRLNRVAGLFQDDAWYVLLAKALATGQGYSLINSPSPGIFPLYPPAFPFLLSLVYRLSPSFPDNVITLKLVSVAAMAGAYVIAYFYFARVRQAPPYLALGVAAATMLCPPMVFLATSSLMSECVYMCLLLAAIYVIEQCLRRDGARTALLYAAIGGVLASIVFLTRSLGVGLIIAAFLYLLRARLVKEALAFALVVALCLGPWAVYSQMRAPTPAQQREQGGHIVYPYTAQFWQVMAGNPTMGQATARDIPPRVWANAKQVFGLDMGRILLVPVVNALIDPAQQAQMAPAEDFGAQAAWGLSLLLSLLVVIGFVVALRERVTLAEMALPLLILISLLWPFQQYRLVLPLAPFLIFYGLMGARALAGLAQRRRNGGAVAGWTAAAAFTLFILAVSIYGNAKYIINKYDSSAAGGADWEILFDELEVMMKRAEQIVPQNGVIAASNPPLTYLFTGRKTVMGDDPAAKIEDWRRLGVRYMLSAAVLSEVARPEESGLPVIYRSRQHRDFWIVDLGDPATR